MEGDVGGAVWCERIAWSAKLVFRTPFELYELYHVACLKWEVHGQTKGGLYFSSWLHNGFQPFIIQKISQPVLFMNEYLIRLSQ